MEYLSSHWTYKLPGYPCIRTDNSRGNEGCHRTSHKIKTRESIYALLPARMTTPTAISDSRYTERFSLRTDSALTNRMIIHGDFAEYCQDETAQLLDVNPDADAIVFANDHMAIGGYAELKARGIRIGETMSVIGFDDSPSSVNMDPPLTTVNINSCELGFRAVYAAVRLAQTGNMKSEALDSRLINRVSCCCHLCTESDLMKDGRHLLDLDIPDIIDILDGRLFGEIADSFYASKVMSAYNRILI